LNEYEQLLIKVVLLYTSIDNSNKYNNCSSPMQEIRKYDVDVGYRANCKDICVDGSEIDKIEHGSYVPVD
jgi:hypothetical protein